MATARSNEFQLVVPKTAQAVTIELGSGFTVPCHLSPEISAVDMEIKWFKETECVCLYKNRQMIEGTSYKDRVNPFTEVLERGDVSLSLKVIRVSDLGDYVCQVTSGDQTEEITVKLKEEIPFFKGLGMRHKLHVKKINRTWNEEDRLNMVVSALMSELEKYTIPEELKRLYSERDKLIQRKDNIILESKQMLQMKGMALKEKDKCLKDMEDKLLETIKELEKTQSQLEEKETQLDNMNKLMSEKERRLENTAKQMETNQLHLYTLRNELQEMKIQLDEQKNKFIHQEKTLQEYKQRQKQSEQEVKYLHCEVKRLKNESSTHLAELNGKCKRLEDTEKLLTEKDAQIKDLEKSKQTALEEKDKLLDKSNDKLLQTTREVEEKQKEIEEKNILMIEKEKLLENTVKQLETSKHQLDTLRNELQENNSKLQLLLEENKLLESSVSTAPVRKRHSRDFEPPTKLRLVLLGSAGSEKSAAVNIILNREEKIQTDTSTEIQQSESRQGEVNGKQVTVVETPDWFCSGLSLEEVREDVRLCVHLSAPGPHAFLLIIPVQQSTGVERAMLEKMEEIWGDRCWRNTMILFTVTDEEQKKNIEDFVQSGNLEVQRLVEKCGNRFHCLNIHQSGDDSQISKLLEKIEKMMEGNTERFYSSEIYLEIESQIRAMERKIMRDREERKEREEREIKEKLKEQVENTMRSIEEIIEQHEGDIKQLNERTVDLERQIRDKRDKEEKIELKRELEKEVERRTELERNINKLKDQKEKEKGELEEKHRQEMEEIRQIYEGEIKMKTERNIMKIILPELQRNILDSKLKMQEELMEVKNKEIETLKNNLLKLKENYSLMCEFHESAVKILKSS